MDTHCQTEAQSRSGKRQTLRAVNFFRVKKGGVQLQTKNILGAVAYRLCSCSLYIIEYMAFFI